MLGKWVSFFCLLPVYQRWSSRKRDCCSKGVDGGAGVGEGKERKGRQRTVQNSVSSGSSSWKYPWSHWLYHIGYLSHKRVFAEARNPPGCLRNCPHVQMKNMFMGWGNDVIFGKQRLIMPEEDLIRCLVIYLLNLFDQGRERQLRNRGAKINRKTIMMRGPSKADPAH